VFVDEGGYDDPRWWHADAVAMLAGGVFVDSTGKPGPATWADGRFDPSLEKYPVTGISWYEADAYARKNGKRLPSPEEWEIAAGAPGVNETAASVYPFHRVEAERKGIVAPRPVGAADWDTLPQAKCRDMGSNVAEWTNRHTPDGSAIVKGAEPGLHPDLFFHYARRAKNSFARLLERSEGRGFRCIEDFQVDNKDADAQGN